MAQSGSIKGRILDKATKEPLPFASVVAELNGTQSGGSQSDFDGEYSIKPLQPGKYTVRVSYVGYNDLVITDVLVSADKITFQDLSMSKKVLETKEVVIESYKVPLIEKGNTSTGATLTREEIEAAPTRDVRGVASLTAGTTQKDEGDDINVRGSRSGATDYYVDGIRIRGSQKLPQGGVEQVSTIVGGTPAQYGDVTGGVVSITTRGPSSTWNGGIEYVTSELFDDYGYNLVSANLSGPIIKKKDELGERSILGFFVSGEYQSEEDPDPSAIGMYKLRDELYNDLSSAPIVPFQTANGFGYNSKANFYTENDFEKVDVKNTDDQIGYRFTGKLDFQPGTNSTFTIGGNYNLNDRESWTFNRSMYNFAENPDIIDTDYRVFARYTQRIGSTYAAPAEGEKRGLRNVYFSLQGEWGVNKQRNQDAQHEDNFWGYGYYGKFSNSRPLDTIQTGANEFSVLNTDAFTYAPAGVNTIQEAYNNTAYDFYQQATGTATMASINTLVGPGGLRNGDAAASVMSIWEGVGNQRNLYQDFDNENYRFTFFLNGDLKNHALRMGFEFEQRVDRGYSLAPRGLWSVGRLYANDGNQLTQIIRDTTSDGTNSYINYESSYTPVLDENGNVINGFYENIRNSLGLSNTDYVDFDALDPSQLSMELFTPDQLLVNNVLGYYYGYDYKGNKLSGTDDYSSAFAKFFTERENGVFKREVPAWQPSYMAFFVQDNFAIDNLNFNIGLRVDRFDANQKAIKDKYLLLDSYNVGEFESSIGQISNRPGNIGDDFIPYVSSASDLSTIVGYRDGEVWYNANGEVVSNPDLIAQQSSTGTIVPAVKPDAGSLAGADWNIDGVFEDYEPQISVMPRVAFAFSITDQAQFFAHYDVLTQRPSSNLRNDPIEYLALVRNPDGSLNNSNLKPERTTDYELGFKQVLSRSSALTISAFYREMKNMIQITKVNFAYPFTYTSYENLDFGTVKGLSLAYDLRRTGNVRLTASYTLQFAEGTGSGANTNVELVDTDQPNIRFIVPLDFDQRHTFVASIDYRYGEGSAYNGPMIGSTPILQNFGANLVFRTNSGTPYTRQARPTREAAAIGWQDNGQRAVEGSVNGARTPWQFRVDLRIDKDFAFNLGKKRSAINVYLQIQNLLDTKNVVGVYRATGNPDDDGFLFSTEGQQLAAAQSSPESFIDQYSIKVQNPDNYSLPRRARLGVRFDF